MQRSAEESRNFKLYSVDLYDMKASLRKPSPRKIVRSHLQKEMNLMSKKTSYVVSVNGKTANVEVDVETENLALTLKVAAWDLGCPSGGSYLISRDGWVNGGLTRKMV